MSKNGREVGSESNNNNNNDKNKNENNTPRNLRMTMTHIPGTTLFQIKWETPYPDYVHCGNQKADSKRFLKR